jgi:small-conductance mechanosensitive channel
MAHASLRRLALGLLAAGLFASAALAEPAAGASDEATLELWNRPIVVLRKTVGERTPAERAAGAAERIAAAPTELMRGDVTIARFSSEYGEGIEVELRGAPAFRIFPADLDPESGETLEQAGEAAAQRLREALAARVLQADAGRIARGALLALGATALFALLLVGLVRSRRFATARLFVASERQIQRVTRMGFDPRRHVLLGAKYAVDALALGLGALLAYLWLFFVFKQFPYSAPWGDRLGRSLVDLGALLGTDLLHAVPGFFTVLVILLVTRALTRVVAHFFQTVGAGRIRSPWLDAETAEATRRIVVGVIWLFALTAAFPFIPGSHSAAFRGIGVLAGLMLSLGSAGIVNQAMSGLVVVYSRAFREGDYVKIGDVEGTVVRRGSLSTKIRNVRNEEVTLPNGVVITAPTVNYTRLAGDGGALVSATVTIGYDAPWRQVHALLELAASRTPGLRETPTPYVVQRALSDFYVEYQLVAHGERSDDRPLALSRLHAQIQDAFNEHGVQIMSPHFLGQPGAPVLVPRERWNAPPATSDSGSMPGPRRAE